MRPRCSEPTSCPPVAAALTLLGRGFPSAASSAAALAAGLVFQAAAALLARLLQDSLSCVETRARGKADQTERMSNCFHSALMMVPVHLEVTTQPVKVFGHLSSCTFYSGVVTLIRFCSPNKHGFHQINLNV